jgi:transglutaminase-like putative cysteine protease
MTERIHYPPVYIGIFVLLMTAVAAVMFTVTSPFQATVYALFWGVIYGAGLSSCRRVGEGNEEQSRQRANGCAGLALVLFLGGYAFSGVETGLILMLLTIQAGRNLALFIRRDLNFACLISLILLLYGAAKAMGGFFLAFIVIYALAAIFTFMADHIDARLCHALGGDRELLTRRMNLPVKGVGLALMTLSLAFAIYLLVPRPASPRVQVFPSSSNWNYDNRHWKEEALRPRPDSQGQNGDGNGATASIRQQPPADEAERPKVNAAEYGGFQERLDVAGAGECCKLSNNVVLYVQADNPLYVRGKVFDSFDGRNWEDSGYGAGKLYDQDGRFTFGEKPQAGDTHQVFTVRQDLPPFIFAAYRPVLVSFPGNVIEADAALALRAPDRLRKDTVYSVASHLEEVEKHPCSGALVAGDEGRSADGRYLALYTGVSERLRGLALDVTKGAGDDLQRAKAVEAYLRDNYAYTLDTVGIRWSGNPVEQFLFDLKAGHCELFASSMVVMLRTLNIPARLVTGFYVNRYNPVTGYYEVREADGHAWVEAYLEPHGWVTFEPTSSFELPKRSQRLFVATGLVRYLGDRSEELIRKNRDSLWVKFLMKIWPMLLKIWAVVMSTFAVLSRQCFRLLDWFLRGGWQAVLLLFAAVVGGWYLWRFLEPAWRLAKLRRKRNGNPQQFLVLCYREMERHFALRGTARAPHITPLEYERLLTSCFLPLAEQIALVTRLFQQAAYGPSPVAMAEAEVALRAFEEIHRWKDPGRKRLLGMRV